MPDPSTYQERREAKKYIEQRIRELGISTYSIRDSARLKMPPNIKAAKKAVAAWDKSVSKRVDKISKRFDNLFFPVRELLILGDFKGALQKIKAIEKARAKIIAEFKV
jgi:hypothetical protein